MKSKKMVLCQLNIKYKQKNIKGAVLVKTNVLLVLPNKLAELGAVYDCLH